MSDLGNQFLLSMFINLGITTLMLVASAFNLRLALRTHTGEAWLHTGFWGLLAGYAAAVFVISSLNYVSPELRDAAVLGFMATRNVVSLLLLIFICAIIILPIISRTRYAKTITLFRAILSSTEMLEEELAQLRQSQQVLQRSNRALEQFAYVASHDLQSPLGVIELYASKLAHKYGDDLNQDALQYLTYITDAASLASSQVSGLLKFSRVGSVDVTAGRVDCNKIIVQIQNVHPGELIRSNNLPPVRGDERLVTSVFQNLIDNAVKFQHPERDLEVVVTARPKGEFIEFAIADNGIGIPADFLGSVFVIFKRGHQRDEYPGTGLGLSLVERIVHHHGGQVWVDSEEGRGSTFYFTLPKDS